MYLQDFRRCEGCFKPAKGRLATLQSQHYECYSESYVKCFWNLCDHQSSTTSFRRSDNTNVVTSQPRKQQLPYKSASFTNKY